MRPVVRWNCLANTVFPQFGLPGWSVRAVIVAALLGLPVAIALAWSFDLSAMGLRREASAPPAGTDSVTTTGSATIPSAPLWRLPSFWIALALGAGLAVSAQQAWQRLILPVFGERPGIAVLPFANLSPDPENAFFAGDREQYRWWLSICRTLDRRMAEATAAQIEDALAYTAEKPAGNLA